MRCTYTLSWAEFSEVYSDSWPKPNVVAIVATLGVAMAFAVFGILLAHALGPEDWLVGLSFYGLSLFLFAVAVWEWRIKTAKLKTQKVKEARSLYDRFYSTEQAFTIDRQGWGHETEISKKEMAWAGILSAVERENVIALVAKDQLTVVPKRILTEDALNLVRGAVLRFPGTKCNIRQSFWNWVLTEFALPWKDQPFAMLGGYALGTGALIFLLRRLGSPARPGDFFWGETLCASILCVIVTAQFWYLALTYITSYRELGAPFEAEFSEKGMRIKKPKVEYFRAWLLFRRFQESGRSFILHADANQHYIIAKNSFSLEDQRVVRTLFKTKVTAD